MIFELFLSGRFIIKWGGVGREEEGDCGEVR